jgi:suppressor for copper-sensitivity B
MLNDPSPWARRAWAKLRSSAAVATALVLLGSAFAGSAQAVELPAGVKLPDGAVATPGAISDGTKVRLLAGVGGVGTLAGISAGLEFQLAPGWKTYWRSPGDAGYPVTVDWGGSRNLAAAEFAWPAPHRFTLFGLDTFGYSDEVVFPITLRPERVGEPLHLAAQVRYLVCRDVCIPGEASVVLDLPAGQAAPTEALQLIDRFAAQVPDAGASHGLRLERAAVGGSAERPTLEITARSEFSFQAPDVLVEGPSGLHFAAPAVRLSDEGKVAHLSLPVTEAPDAPRLQDARLTVTLVDDAPGGRRGLEKTLTPSPPEPSGHRLLPILGLALLGGLILNLMPCVLPVLSLKLLGMVGQGGREVRAVRASFLASAAGVIAAFLALAAALAGLQAAGLAVGWGIQFQQPLFLAAMLLLVTLFACNLWGWFEIPLPGFLGDLAARRGGDHGLAGNFVTGMFATLLATPCSAPFLGTAVGFALTGTTIELFAVFATLGIGLALPYLLVAAVPRLAGRLPRPGRWMIGLRYVLGLALAGTAIWLLTVLAAQLGGRTAILAGLLLLAIVAALWLRRRRAGSARPAWAAIAVCAVALLLVAGAPPAADPRVAPSSAGVWQDFDEPAIGGLVGDGKVVVVDVTADWCITCQVNKQLVLDDPAVAARLAAPGVVAMQADWTRPDEAIARYLASFGRYGIPFNAVYGPGAPDGIVLSELLSKSDLMSALEQAAGSAGMAAAQPAGTSPESQ